MFLLPAAALVAAAGLSATAADAADVEACYSVTVDVNDDQLVNEADCVTAP